MYQNQTCDKTKSKLWKKTRLSLIFVLVAPSWPRLGVLVPWLHREWNILLQESVPHRYTLVSLTSTIERQPHFKPLLSRYQFAVWKVTDFDPLQIMRSTQFRKVSHTSHYSPGNLSSRKMKIDELNQLRVLLVRTPHWLIGSPFLLPADIDRRTIAELCVKGIRCEQIHARWRHLRLYLEQFCRELVHASAQLVGFFAFLYV